MELRPEVAQEYQYAGTGPFVLVRSRDHYKDGSRRLDAEKIGRVLREESKHSAKPKHKQRKTAGRLTCGRTAFRWRKAFLAH